VYFNKIFTLNLVVILEENSPRTGAERKDVQDLYLVIDSYVAILGQKRDHPRPWLAAALPESAIRWLLDQVATTRAAADKGDDPGFDLLCRHPPKKGGAPREPGSIQGAIVPSDWSLEVG
jgi:hypothetical protein